MSYDIEKMEDELVTMRAAAEESLLRCDDLEEAIEQLGGEQGGSVGTEEAGERMQSALAEVNDSLNYVEEVSVGFPLALNVIRKLVD